MTKSLQRTGVRSPATTGLRSYALAKTPRDVLELLRASSTPPVLSPAQAERTSGNEPFIVLTDDGFTLFQPWRLRVTTPEGVSGEELAIGPAVVGRLVETPRGCRLDLRVRRYAPVPAQRRRLRRITVIMLGVLTAMVAATSAHPLLLGLAGVTIAGLMASLLLHRRQQRSRDVRDLLAIVERTFGPLELAASDDDPHRRDEPGQEG